MASAFSNYVTHLVIILYGFWNVNCFLPIFCIFSQTASLFFGKYRPLVSLLEIPFGIPDLHQGQTLRPGRCSRHFSILRRKDFFYFLRRIITLSNLKQCSGDNPHHIVEKTVSGDPEADQIVFFFQTRFIDGTDRVGHLWLACMILKALQQQNRR